MLTERKKILLTSYDGLPSESQGGPNNIIAKIIKSADRDRFSFGFLSYRNFIDNPRIGETKNLKPGLKKKITDYLYYNTYAYRLLTSNRLYLKRHFELRDKYFMGRSQSVDSGIVHSHDALSGYYFSDNKNARKILTVHGNGSIESDWADAASQNTFVKELMPELKKREIKAFNNADVVTFPGEYARDLFLSDYGKKLVRDKEIRVIHNGVDVQLLKRIMPDKDILKNFGFDSSHDAVFLNPASHVRQKNIDKIIVVAEALVRSGRNPLFINAGTGPLTSELKAHVKRKNLSRNVCFAGKLSHEDIISLMKHSDAVVMMSDRVIFDLVILEASACGVPLVTNLSGGNREMLESYKGLVEIKDDSPVRTAELIEKFIYSGKVNKFNNTSFGFDIDSMIAGYEKLYEDIS